ncbi:hypothetical protein [Xanthomonas arboricola]|uniref:hypothetical protein n=1 Tax=Xanthomonas arboricola TaxID=56448 RepID=UPI0016ACB547|nr:hypothetical protein [Xanthomonas arboricola]
MEQSLAKLQELDFCTSAKTKSSHAQEKLLLQEAALKPLTIGRACLASAVERQTLI